MGLICTLEAGHRDLGNSGWGSRLGRRNFGFHCMGPMNSCWYLLTIPVIMPVKPPCTPCLIRLGVPKRKNKEEVLCHRDQGAQRLCMATPKLPSLLP